MPRRVHVVVVKPPSAQHHLVRTAGASADQNEHVVISNKHEVTADNDLQNLMILANTSETTSNTTHETHATATTPGSAEQIAQAKLVSTKYFCEHEVSDLSSIAQASAGAVVIQQTSEPTEPVTVLQETAVQAEHAETIIIKQDEEITNTATLQLLSPIDQQGNILTGITLMPSSLPLMTSQMVEIPAETYNKWFGVSSEHDVATTTQHTILQQVPDSGDAMGTQQEVILTRKMSSIMTKTAGIKGASPRPRYTGEKKFRCDICGRMFPSTSNLTRHQRLHTGERPYNCRYCNRDFIQRDHLKRHLAVEHTGTFNHQCPVCGKKFQERCRLATHIHNHTGDRPFPCTLCAKSFATKAALDGHKVWHTGERNFECEFCLKRFVTYPGLSAHRKIHTGDKRHKCQFCGKTFIARKDCISHERLHTGDKPFECPECHKCYPRSTALTQHLKTHSDVRPFPCKFCNKSFRQKPALKNHVMIHLDSWPFKCDFCFKKFRRKDSFLAHTARHTGEMPFKCSLCPKVFAQRKVLQQHYHWHKKNGTVLHVDMEIEVDESPDVNPAIETSTPEETWDKAGATVLTNSVNYAIAIHQYAASSRPSDTTQDDNDTTHMTVADDSDTDVDIETAIEISDPTSISTTDEPENKTMNSTPNHCSLRKGVMGKKDKHGKHNTTCKTSTDQNVVHKLLSKSALQAIQFKLNRALSKTAGNNVSVSDTVGDPQPSSGLAKETDPLAMLTEDTESQHILSADVAKEMDPYIRLSDNSVHDDDDDACHANDDDDDDPCVTLDPPTMLDSDLSRFEMKYMEVLNEVVESEDVFNRERSYISVDVLPVKLRKACRRKSV